MVGWGGLRAMNLQAAAVRIIRRAQWFLISFPMLSSLYS